MKDTSRIFYEVLAVNEQTGERRSLGIGRDFQAHFCRNSLSAQQRAEGWSIETKERKDLGVPPGVKSGGGSRRRIARGRRR
jgi:hypothetical protein